MDYSACNSFGYWMPKIIAMAMKNTIHNCLECQEEYSLKDEEEYSLKDDLIRK